MMLHEIFYYGFFLGCTFGTEFAVVLILAGKGMRRRAVWDCAILNLFTHPLVYLLYLVPGLWAVWLGLYRQWEIVLVLEIGVVLVEFAGYLLLTRLKPWRAALLSLTANGIGVAGMVFAEETWMEVLRWLRRLVY